MWMNNIYITIRLSQMEGGERNAVQERIKKMMELKKSQKQRESGEFSKRLKSGTGLKE